MSHQLKWLLDIRSTEKPACVSSNLTLHSYHATASVIIHNHILQCKYFFYFFYIFFKWPFYTHNPVIRYAFSRSANVPRQPGIPPLTTKNILPYYKAGCKYQQHSSSACRCHHFTKKRNTNHRRYYRLDRCQNGRLSVFYSCKSFSI